jgi:hypothetical protein
MVTINEPSGRTDVPRVSVDVISVNQSSIQREFSSYESDSLEGSYPVL